MILKMLTKLIHCSALEIACRARKTTREDKHGSVLLLIKLLSPFPKLKKISTYDDIIRAVETAEL